MITQCVRKIPARISWTVWCGHWASKAFISRLPQGMPNTLCTSAAQNLILLFWSMTLYLLCMSILSITHLLNFRFNLLMGGNFKIPPNPICSTRYFLYSENWEIIDTTFCTDVREVGKGPCWLGSWISGFSPDCGRPSILVALLDPEDAMVFASPGEKRRTYIKTKSWYIVALRFKIPWVLHWI